LEKRLIAAPILRPPHTLLADKDRPGNKRIRDHRLIECRGLGKQRSGDNDPFARITILEIRIGVLREEIVEARRGIADVETRLAAVAINLLNPRAQVAGFKCAIVLIPALQMREVVWSNRKTLELDGRKSLVHAMEVARHLRQKLLTERQIISAKPALGCALRSNVRKESVRAHHAAVGAIEEQAG